jgi:hypothetical protein
MSILMTSDLAKAPSGTFWRLKETFREGERIVSISLIEDRGIKRRLDERLIPFNDLVNMTDQEVRDQIRRLTRGMKKIHENDARVDEFLGEYR